MVLSISKGAVDTPIDTTAVINDHFAFQKRKLDEPFLAHISVYESGKYINGIIRSSIWVENSEIEIIADKEDKARTKIIGSRINTEAEKYGYFWEYRNTLKSRAERSRILQDKMLKHVKENPDSYYTLIGIEQYANRVGLLDRNNAPAKLNALLSLLNKNTHSYTIYRKVVDKINKLESLQIGRKLPLLVAFTLEGQKKVVESKGARLTLIEFWGLGCVPCIEKQPALAELYEQYRNKGFEIMEVSLDHNHVGAWKKFVKERKLPWQNLVQSANKREQANTVFDISYIPANYLVDANNTIVAVDISINELNNRLKKELGGKLN